MNSKYSHPLFSLISVPFVIFLSLLLLSSQLQAEEMDGEKVPSISLANDMEKAVREEAARVGEHLQEQARSFFERSPLDFDLNTVRFVQQWALTLPLKLPALIRHVLEQGRLLGFVGSILMAAFIIAVFYSLFGQKRVLKRLEKALSPFQEYIPEAVFPHILSLLKIIVASLIPLLLYGIYNLIQAFISYQAPWFLIAGNLLMLWSLGALLINLFREVLTSSRLPIPPVFGKSLFNGFRVVILYILFSLAIFLGAEAFKIPADVLALLKFVISLSIVFILLLLLVRKKYFLGILPELPYQSYQIFARGLERYYFPAIFLTFLSGLLWCFGYKALCKLFWMKTWAVVGAFFGIMIFYHILQGSLRKWIEKKEEKDKTAHFLYQAIRSLLVYATVITVFSVILNLLGLFEPIQRVMSFPVLNIGETPLSLWTLIKAIFIMMAFIFLARLLCAWLDYKVYPSIKVEEGLGYAINTFLNYLFIALGFLFSLRTMGLDLRVLMVFAGAIGIGLGLGLQNMAANLVAGISLIFGRRVRKGDWLQIGDTLGRVQEVNLRITKVVTRDNIEYLIPNGNLTSNTIVNYSLSDPLIRIHIPVGVSYSANPQEVKDILLKVANENAHVNKEKPSIVRFSEYGDSSINFELLVWIDVRRVGVNDVQSELYYAIFQALAEADIEIPFPQRDLHIRSGLPLPLQEKGSDPDFRG